jgi:hypothetical protein
MVLSPRVENEAKMYLIGRIWGKVTGIRIEDRHRNETNISSPDDFIGLIVAERTFSRGGE